MAPDISSKEEQSASLTRHLGNAKALEALGIKQLIEDSTIDGNYDPFENYNEPIKDSKYSPTSYSMPSG